MKDFAACIQTIDETNKTTKKVAALKAFFDVAEDEDKLWCIALLSHRRPKRPVTTTLLRQWTAEESGIADWLFEQSYHIVGDLAETIALLISAKNPPIEEERSLSDYIALILRLRGAPEAEQRETITRLWHSLPYFECFLFNKILTGSFRIGVSQKLMTRALSQHLGMEEAVVAHRLMGDWQASDINFQSLLLEEDGLGAASRPYPFYLAYPWEEDIDKLGDPMDWQIEWKWDGIRGQLIRRAGATFLWSRGEELVTDRYPEIVQMAESLPDGTVLDGEILPWREGRPLDFALLQKRIGRKTVGKKLLAEVPVTFMAYDILEDNGEDIRQRPVVERRAILEERLADIPDMELSPLVQAKTWADYSRIRTESRQRQVEGFMMKHRDSAYKHGRVKGEVWKWKVEPYTIDAVLTYAMRGHGRRADLYTDYTFGLWQDGQLVTFAKAYSGLTDAELKEVDRFVKKNTLQRFGPVREVKPELVFELAFEGVSKSTRHKSGVATRFPRIKRWRRDKKAEEADSLEMVKAML
jgi:DNA ligase-1